MIADQLKTQFDVVLDKRKSISNTHSRHRRA